MTNQEIKSKCTCDINGAEDDIGHFAGCPADTLSQPADTSAPEEERSDVVIDKYCDNCYKKKQESKPPSNQKDWEERFDKKFSDGDVFGDIGKEIKDFIRQVEAEAEEKAHQELLEKVREILADTFLMSGTDSDYNQGFNDAVAVVKKKLALVINLTREALRV